MNKNFIASVLSSMLFGLCSFRAARAQSLIVGTNYVDISVTFNTTSETEGGGNVTQTTFNGVVLPNVYCVDLAHTISAGGTYSSTSITNDGKIYGTAVNNAGEVAWLMDKYAQAAYYNRDQQGALQAAIWKVVFGTNFALNASPSNDSTLIADYNADMTALGADANTGNGGKTAPVSDLGWISAGPGTYQGLVYNVPEPGVAGLVAGLLVTGSLFTFGRKMKKR